jgi:hypothetical protein
MSEESHLLERAESYAHRKRILIQSKDMLGYGSDGSVWGSSVQTAVKAFNRERNYLDEVECYRRLRAAGVTEIGMFNVPVLEGYDDELLVIEISIVQPPYLLDFGKVYLDRQPVDLYDEQMMENATAEWRERFGDRWDKVSAAMYWLRQYGIYYYDPRPGNIWFGDEGDEL